MANALPLYSPLDSLSTQIRLFHLLPSHNFDERLAASLEVVSLKSCPQYSALSHVWGTIAASNSIRLNGHDLGILANLELALRHLRDTDHIRTLWIDALCIDQSNILEKQVQIPLMKEIYTTASRVLVWLGATDANIDESAQHIANPYLTLEDEDEIVNRLLVHRGIVLKPWWSRIWVVQEFIVARDEPLFLCGQYKWPWTRLRSHLLGNSNNFLRNMSIEKLADHINRLAGNFSLENGSTHDIIRAYAEISALSDMKAEYEAYGRSISLQSASIHTRRREATIERDRVYGILGLLSDDERSRVKISYDVPLGKLYLDTMLSCWNDGDVMHLMSAIGFMDCSRQDEIPSWTLNFSKRTLPALFFVPYKHHPDLWKRQIRLDPPRERDGKWTLQWSGRMVDYINSCYHIPVSAKADPNGIVAILRSIRDDVEMASSQRIRPEFDILNSAISDVFGNRDNFTALLTNESVPSEQDARIRRYLDMDWFVDFLTALNPSTTSTEALIRMVARYSEVPSLEQTISDVTSFTTAFFKYATGLRVFTTTKGYIGVASESIEVGNCIALLDDYQIPMILQRTVGGSFKIVGFSYIPGVVVPLGCEPFFAGRFPEERIFEIN